MYNALNKERERDNEGRSSERAEDIRYYRCKML